MRIEVHIEGAVARLAAEAGAGVGHQGEEIGGVALVEGLGEFGQHVLAPVRQLGGDDTGRVAPIELADLHVTGRRAVLGGGVAVGRQPRWRRPPAPAVIPPAAAPIVAFFAA